MTTLQTMPCPNVVTVHNAQAPVIAYWFKAWVARSAILWPKDAQVMFCGSLPAIPQLPHLGTPSQLLLQCHALKNGNLCSTWSFPNFLKQLHTNKPGLSRQEHSVFLTPHQKLYWGRKGREQPGLTSTAEPKWHNFLKLTSPKSCHKPQPTANGSRYSKEIRFHWKAGEPREIWGQCFLFPHSCQWMFMVQLWGQWLPNPAVAVGSALWKQGMSEASFRPWVAFWTPCHPFEVADGNPAL